MSTYVVVAACIVSGGHVLLTQRDSKLNRGEWELPGGKANLGESLEDALRREIKEELGWNVTPVRLVHTQINTYDDDGEDYLVLYYECLPEREHEWPIHRPFSLWVDYTAQLHGLFCLPGTAEAIARVLGECPR